MKDDNVIEITEDNKESLFQRAKTSTLNFIDRNKGTLIVAGIATAVIFVQRKELTYLHGFLEENGLEDLAYPEFAETKDEVQTTNLELAG